MLPRLVGLHKAKELAFFADIISAKEALELGIVNRVVADTEIDTFVDEWARRLAAGPPIALSMTKKMLNEGLPSRSSRPSKRRAGPDGQLRHRRHRRGDRRLRRKREPRFREVGAGPPPGPVRRRVPASGHVPPRPPQRPGHERVLRGHSGPRCSSPSTRSGKLGGADEA